MFKPGVLLATVVAAVAAMVPAPAEAHADCQLPVFGPGSRYHPKFKPSRHTADVTNPWFPLKPRRTLVSVGMKDGKKALDVVDITPRTRAVAGVRTRVVEDRLYLTECWRSAPATITRRTVAATSGTSARTLPSWTAMAEW
jgi:hypothetical protein